MHVEVVVVEMVNMMLEVRDDRAMFVLSLVFSFSVKLS